jgi:4-hydroxy-tetrahydrodipicolinate reductase
MSKTTLAIHGAAGRMGRRLVALGTQDSQFQVVAAIDHAACMQVGKDAGELAGVGKLGVAVSDQWPVAGSVDAVIDFSSPAGALAAMKKCAELGLPLVLATTGLEAEHHELLQQIVTKIPVCYSPSMSLAVNLTMKLAQQAARVLKNVSSGVDVEIIERHHRYKEDSPSGTALKFGQIVSQEMGLDKPMHGRHGQVGQRSRNEIGYHAVRTGDNPGEHTIVFGMLGETIELRVAASNRDCYVQGAFAAARFIQGKPAGLYSMSDVLGLG